MSSRVILLLGLCGLVLLVTAALASIQLAGVEAASVASAPIPPSPDAAASLPPGHALTDLATLPAPDAAAVFLEAAQRQFTPDGSAIDERLAEPAAVLAERLRAAEYHVDATVYATPLALAEARVASLRALLEGAGLPPERLTLRPADGLGGIVLTPPAP